MATSKPTVVDEADFEAQLEALVDAAQEGDVHDSDISAALSTHAKAIESERWD